MKLSLEFLLQLLVTLLTGAGVYAGVKVDIAALTATVAAVQSVQNGHTVQIDKLRDARGGRDGNP